MRRISCPTSTRLRNVGGQFFDDVLYIFQFVHDVLHIVSNKQSDNGWNTSIIDGHLNTYVSVSNFASTCGLDALPGEGA